MDLNEEFERLYRESPVDVQKQFDTLQEHREKARELADMVGSVVVEEFLPLEILELTADLLKEDCRQIRQAAEEIAEEERAVHGINTGSTLL
ncbi:MAG: hypothetical protein PHR62_02765 [Paludibacter sp.]|nr:hypothetical protein [Paludibacter sp.]